MYYFFGSAMDVDDIVDIEYVSNENEVQAPFVEGGNTASDDQVVGESSSSANAATPTSMLKASKATTSSKDRDIVLVP